MPATYHAAMHLSKYMERYNLRDGEVGAAIGRHRATISRYRRNKLLPDWQAMQALRLYTQGRVSEADWRGYVPPSQ